MGWNEPPGGQGPKDPWGNRGGRKNNDGPPDLDEVVRNLQQRLGGLFGKRPPVGGGGSAGNNPLLWAGIIILLVIWLMYDMFYVIDQQQRGVVLRFGEYQTTLQPGLSMRMPRPLERVIKVNTGQVNTVSHQASMLTQDENIVDVEEAVQWRVQNPENYLFEVAAPSSTLRQVVESAIREIIGRNKLDFILTQGRGEIESLQIERMQQVLDEYNAGILVVSVDMQPAQPPDPVKDAFDDAIKAREDEQRLINEAEAYRNEIIPRARGEAARIREEALGYKDRVVARAQGNTNRFEQVLEEYQQASQVTRERLYLDTMEYVLGRNSKIMMDTEGGSNLTYLPIDRLLEQSRGKGSSDGSGSGSTSTSPLTRPLPPMSSSSSSSSQSEQGTRNSGNRNREAR